MLDLRDPRFVQEKLPEDVIAFLFNTIAATKSVLICCANFASTVCSGSIVVTSLDCGPRGPGFKSEWVPIFNEGPSTAHGIP